MGVWLPKWKKQAEEWTYIEFEKHQVPNGLARTTIEANAWYLHIVLHSMRVVHVRKGISKFYGAAHSWISVAHIGQGTAEFQVLTTPSQLKDVDAANLDRVITMDRRLLGPTPFRGGDVSLELGLFSIKSADLAGPFLEILQTMSGLAGVSFVSAALPLLGPIKDGINLLAGAEKDSILEVGYSRDAWAPETGFAAVIRVPRGTIDTKSLRIGTDGRLEDKTGVAVRDFPYMVWSVDVKDKRPDWFQIPELKAAYDALNADVKRGELDAVNTAFAVLRRSVLTSPDLLFKDAELIVKVVDQQVRQTMQPIQTGYQSGPTKGLKALEDLTPFGATATTPQE